MQISWRWIVTYKEINMHPQTSLIDMNSEFWPQIDQAYFSSVDSTLKIDLYERGFFVSYTNFYLIWYSDWCVNYLNTRRKEIYIHNWKAIKTEILRKTCYVNWESFGSKEGENTRWMFQVADSESTRDSLGISLVYDCKKNN